MSAEPSVTVARWTEDEARALIREVISDLAPTRGEVVSSSRLVEDLGCHSLSLLELAFSLEDEFDLPTIDEATAREIVTVGDVERYVFEHLRANGQLSAA